MVIRSIAQGSSHLYQHEADRCTCQEQSPNHVQTYSLQNSSHRFNVRIQRLDVCIFESRLWRIKEWILSSAATGRQQVSLVPTTTKVFHPFIISGNLRCRLDLSHRNATWMCTWPDLGLCRSTRHPLFGALPFWRLHRRCSLICYFQKSMFQPLCLTGMKALVSG